MRKLWADRAWDNYEYRQTQDEKALKKINTLIKEIERDPYEGMGKPEPLKHYLMGWWSRRIDNTNRIVYRIKDENLEISQCKGHYNDK